MNKIAKPQTETLPRFSVSPYWSISTSYLHQRIRYATLGRLVFGFLALASIGEAAFKVIKPAARIDLWQKDGLIGKHPELRAYVHGLLKDGPTSPGLTKLARTVAENPDEDGLLLLVGFENDLKRSFIGGQTIKRAVTEDVPSESWVGAYNVVPVLAVDLRQKLLEMTTNAAARCLRQTDWIRDEYGMPEAEPRHPDLTSGRPWPILVPGHYSTSGG